MTREEWIAKFKAHVEIVPPPPSIDVPKAMAAFVKCFEAGFDVLDMLPVKDRTDTDAHDALVEAFRAGLLSHVHDVAEAVVH